MDPRDAAKVTAPDLLKAFNEGRGHEDGVEPETSKVWVAFLEHEEVLRVVEYPLAQLDVALADIKVHVEETLQAGALLFTGTEEPAIVEDARAAISASDT